MQQDFAIDPAFSVYRLVERRRSNALLNHRLTMNHISYEIENATILGSAQNRIFASFQRMSRFLPQAKRYRSLAAKAESIYVFGVPDVVPPEIENVVYVPLAPTDQMAKEWFVVSYGENYYSALATEELSHIDDPDKQRQFRGIWTFDIKLIRIMHDWLTSTVDAPPMSVVNVPHNPIKNAEIILKGIMSLEVRLSNEGLSAEGQRIRGIVRDELVKTLETQLRPERVRLEGS